MANVFDSEGTFLIFSSTLAMCAYGKQIQNFLLPAKITPIMHNELTMVDRSLRSRYRGFFNVFSLILSFTSLDSYCFWCHVKINTQTWINIYAQKHKIYAGKELEERQIPARDETHSKVFFAPTDQTKKCNVSTLQINQQRDGIQKQKRKLNARRRHVRNSIHFSETIKLEIEPAHDSKYIPTNKIHNQE